MRKAKFKPEITRVKLNPEQAVLQCLCWDRGAHLEPGNYYSSGVPIEVCSVFPQKEYLAKIVCDYPEPAEVADLIMYPDQTIS